MKRFVPLAVGLLVGAGCVRLGVWQLDRLQQRRDRNATLEARLRATPLDVAALASDPQAPADSLHFRRAVVTGRFDFPRELIDAARSFRGAPGVYLLTPLRVADGAGILVNRGWAYAADGRTIDRPALVEGESATVAGVLLMPQGPRAVRPESLTLPYRVPGVTLLRTDPPDSLPAGIVVHDLPALGEGSHLSYAVQWFAFATIAVVGGGILTAKGRRGPA